MKQLLASKTHLIEGGQLPDSYKEFLDHYNSWRINHERWKKAGVDYSLHSKINFPLEFNRDVRETFSLLKAKHEEQIRRQVGDSQFRVTRAT